jgi:hypothetical protein
MKGLPERIADPGDFSWEWLDRLPLDPICDHLKCENRVPGVRSMVLSCGDGSFAIAPGLSHPAQLDARTLTVAYEIGRRQRERLWREGGP